MPEPSTLALLGVGAVGLLGWALAAAKAACSTDPTRLVRVVKEIEGYRSRISQNSVRPHPARPDGEEVLLAKISESPLRLARPVKKSC